MEEFSYVARNAAGEISQGEIRAISTREAARHIQQQGLYISSLKPVSHQGALQHLRFCFGARRYAMVFCRQLSIMVNAELSLSESMKVLSQNARGAQQRVLLDLYEQLQMGQSLADALKQHSRIFPRNMIYLIAAGEAGGTLPAALERLAVSLEKSYAAREKLTTAMFYPVFLFFISSLAAGFIFCFVLPTFVALFDHMNMVLPLPTRLVLGFSHIVLSYGGALFCMGCMLLGSMVFFYRREAVRVRFDYYLLRLPVLGNLLVSLEMMQLMAAMSSLWASGIVADKAVELAREVTANAYLRQVFSRAREEIRRGCTLSDALRSCRVMAPMILELLAAGEAAGEMDSILQKISDFCKIEAENLSERLQALMEPMMILFLGVLIGTIVLAIALPILDTMTAFS